PITGTPALAATPQANLEAPTQTGQSPLTNQSDASPTMFGEGMNGALAQSAMPHRSLNSPGRTTDMRSEAFDWRPGEGGLAWRQVQTFPRRNTFWKPFLTGAFLT